MRWLGLSIFTSLLVACGGGEDLFGSGETEPGAGAGAPTGGTSGSGAGASVALDTIVINEIMYNPGAVADETGEWLELYNPTDAPIDMHGWVLRDNGANEHVIDGLVVSPGQYAVLARSAQTNGGLAADYVYGDDFALANMGDTVIVEDAGGEQMDIVAYDVDGGWPASVSGVSIELEAESFDNYVASNWVHAVMPYGAGDLGTPGKPNGGELAGFVVDESAVSWHNPDLKASVLFAPLDDVQGYVLSQLEGATQSIALAFFNVRLDAVKNTLIQKKNAGVSVKVILDKKQQDQAYNTMGAELLAAGIDVTLVENTSATDATMHDKFAIVDGHLVMTGSANYSHTAMLISDEELIAFDDATLAARYALEFEELLAGGEVASAAYPAATPMQVFMGPEDSLPYRVVDLLDNAQTSAVIAMFQLNAQMIVDAIIDAHQRGVKVVVVLDDVQASDPSATTDETLIAAGVPVVLAHNTGNSVAEMHSKYMVVDHHRVLMGSYNWTNLGSFYNDENIVLIDDAHLAARFEGRFGGLLNSYASATPAALGMATGMQALTLEVSNVVLDAGVALYVVGGPFGAGVAMNDTKLDTSVAAGTRFTYHYEVRAGGTTLALEDGAHTFSVPYAAGPFAIRDAFIAKP